VGIQVQFCTRGLYNCNDSRHELFACCCLEVREKSPHSAAAEIPQELSPVLEKDSQHFGNGKHHLSMPHIQENLLSHPLSPFLHTLRVAAWAECPCLAGKSEKKFHPALFIGTFYAGKTVLRVRAVEILLYDFLHDRAKISILLLESRLVFRDEPLKAVKEHPVQNGLFRVPPAIDSSHGMGKDVSRKKPIASPLRNILVIFVLGDSDVPGGGEKCTLPFTGM
jgi:hypothetical protein